MFYAAIYGLSDVMDILKQKGGLEARGANGWTPLIRVAMRGVRHVAAAVDHLLDAGADPNATDINGKTALMLAVEANNIPMVDRLLREGADIQPVMPMSAQYCTWQPVLMCLSSYYSYRILELIWRKQTGLA